MPTERSAGKDAICFRPTGERLRTATLITESSFGRFFEVKLPKKLRLLRSGRRPYRWATLISRLGILDESCWRTARFWSFMSEPVVSDEDFAAGPLLLPGLPGIPTMAAFRTARGLR